MRPGPDGTVLDIDRWTKENLPHMLEHIPELFGSDLPEHREYDPTPCPPDIILSPGQQAAIDAANAHIDALATAEESPATTGE